MIGTDIEGYRPPSLFVDELDLSGSVGKSGRNKDKDVIATKKALARLGAFDIDLADSKSTVVTPRFLESLRTVQQGLGEMLHLNFGQRQRALEFLEKKITKGLPTDPVIKSFDVPKAFLEKLRAASIRQTRATEKDPDRIFPRRVDENQAKDQFELPNNWIKELQRQIIQGTGRIERPEDVRLQLRR